MAYAAGGIYPVIPSEVVRVRRGGVADTLPTEPRQYALLRVSADGHSLVLATAEEGPGTGIYVYDIARGASPPPDRRGD